MGLAIRRGLGPEGHKIKVNALPLCFKCGCRCPLHGASANNERWCLECLEGKICVDHNCCGKDDGAQAPG